MRSYNGIQYANKLNPLRSRHSADIINNLRGAASAHKTMCFKFHKTGDIRAGFVLCGMAAQRIALHSM